MWLQGARRKVVEFFTKTCTCPLLWESDTMRSASVADLLRELAQERALRESAETAMEQAQVERDELRAQWDRNTVGLIRERDEARAERDNYRNNAERERAALSAAADRATDWYLSGSHGSEEDLRRAVLGGIGEAAVVARIVDQRDAWLQCCCGECSVLAAAADRAVVAFEEAMRDDMDDTYSKAHIRDAVMGPS